MCLGEVPKATPGSSYFLINSPALHAFFQGLSLTSSQNIRNTNT
uniref:Uncharacterized protein n=1 Tax=Rhizophora mucronata TaxID=61149 RepID=A0A2P2K3B5_RHIMU